MAFCKNCGASLPDGSTFCSSCGTPVQDNNAQYQQAQPQQQEQYQQPYQQPVTNAQQADAESNKAMGVLSYLGILVLIPIFAAKNSPFARYHANQGLVLAIFEVAYSIAVAIVKGILSAALPWSMWGIYTAVSTILGLAEIFFLVVAIMGIVNACKGEMKELPLIGKIKILK